MNQTNPYNTNQNQKTNRPKYKAPANFIEALKDAGGSIVKDTAKGITHDLIGGIAQQTTDTIFNLGSTPQNQNQNPQESDTFDFESFMKASEKREQMVRQQMEVKQQYETPAVEIFNQRQMEVEKKIEAIRSELQQLAKAIVSLDQSTQAAISQELVDPGTYHLNFFEKLLKVIQLLKKRVVESRNWANLHAQRSQAKSYYWQQSGSKVSGTKFSLSSERSVVTQTG